MKVYKKHLTVSFSDFEDDNEQKYNIVKLFSLYQENEKSKKKIMIIKKALKYIFYLIIFFQ